MTRSLLPARAAAPLLAALLTSAGIVACDQTRPIVDQGDAAGGGEPSSSSTGAGGAPASSSSSAGGAGGAGGTASGAGGQDAG